METGGIPDGRKITRNMENPFDNILIDISAAVNPALRRLGVTPNMLTFVSFAFGLACAYFVYQSHFITALVCLLISYLFDCMDGNMARMFNMVTKFGDYLDHITDLIEIICVLVAIIMNKSLSVRMKATFIGVVWIFFALCCFHMSCQENIYDRNESPTLSSLGNMCKEKDYIFWSRYIGSGTLILVICVMLIICSFKTG